MYTDQYKQKERTNEKSWAGIWYLQIEHEIIRDCRRENDEINQTSVYIKYYIVIIDRCNESIVAE